MFDQGVNVLEEKDESSESAVARNVAGKGDGVSSPDGDETKGGNHRAKDGPGAMPPPPIASFRDRVNNATLDRQENRRAVCFFKREERAARNKALKGGTVACKKATAAKRVLQRALHKEKASIAALEKAVENLSERVELRRKHKKAKKPA